MTGSGSGMGCQNDGEKLCRGLPFAPLGGDWAAVAMKRQPRSRGSALSIADKALVRATATSAKPQLRPDFFD